MVDAAESRKVFRRFQFQFVNVFFHEIGGHLLFTYLYHGLPSTPRQVMPPTWSGQEGGRVGESGRTLEAVVFGGTLEFFDIPKACCQKYTPFFFKKIDKQNIRKKKKYLKANRVAHFHMYMCRSQPRGSLTTTTTQEELRDKRLMTP